MLEGLQTHRKEQHEWGKWEEPDLTIWAEGVRAAENPLWKDVGWRNAHGDILTVKIPDLSEDRIYNFGKFLVPLGDHQFRCGSTYAWIQESSAPRMQGRKELEEELRSVVTVPFEVLEHQAGIRPVALARVPIAGPHPEETDQWIFNGFGSKGVLMAPWMAVRMCSLLLSGEELPKETRAARRIQRQRDRQKTLEGQRKA
jgi:glycine/D-amino acid oxidase-like deaminating enzyme